MRGQLVLANTRGKKVEVVTFKEEEDVEMKESNEPLEKERQLFKEMLT